MPEAKIIELGAHSKMTVEQALAISSREEFEHIAIIGLDKDGDLVVRSSHMSRETALWVAELFKLHVLELR